MKTFTKPNCNICMEERLKIIKQLCDKRVIIMNKNSYIYGACISWYLFSSSKTIVYHSISLLRGMAFTFHCDDSMLCIYTYFLYVIYVFVMLYWPHSFLALVILWVGLFLNICVLYLFYIIFIWKSLEWIFLVYLLY